MKTTIKFLAFLFIIHLLTACGTLPVEAFIAVNCPEIRTDNNYSDSGTDSSTKNVAQSDGTESEFFLSYNVGVGTKVPINDKFSFNPAIAVSGKGNKTENIGFEDKLTSTYIDVPLLLNYKLGESKFSLVGGLQPSILVSAKRKIKGVGNEQSQNVTDQFNSIDLAANIGAKYQFENGLGLNVGYNHGLLNINKSDVNFGSSFKSYNRTLSVGISYWFNKN